VAARWVWGGLLGGYVALQVLGRTAGSTRAERRTTLPGDDLIACPHVVTDHAATIDAPPAAVWPWLTQMGWHLGGYYTPRWVDALLFPHNWPSLERLDPALVRDLRVGDTIPDGAPGTAWYDVVGVEPARVLLLRSTSHLPPGWRDRFGASVDWTWCFALTELAGERTRLHLRVRGRTSPWWVTAGYVGLVVPADLVMATGMLRGIRRRVEEGAPGQPASPYSRSPASPRPGTM
jgi:hypothetical protein